MERNIPWGPGFPRGRRHKHFADALNDISIYLESGKQTTDSQGEEGPYPRHQVIVEPGCYGRHDAKVIVDSIHSLHTDAISALAV